MARAPVHATTIVSVRSRGKVALGGDGQVTVGATVMKHDAKKVRALESGRVLVGFAGSAADAFALIERFEAKLKDAQGNVRRAAVDLAKDWRTDRVLRRLEAMIAVVDRKVSLIVSGSGDVIEPEDGVIGIGSGGPFAASAAKALLRDGRAELTAREIVEASLRVAADVCIYTNDKINVLELDAEA